MSNPLCNLKGCCILGEDEQLLDEIDFMNYGCLNLVQREDPEFQTHWKDLFLISRNKVFSEEVLWLFLCIYKEYRQSDVLQESVHWWSRAIVWTRTIILIMRKHFKEEYSSLACGSFLRTIPKGQYPLLPEEILRYFTYSKSLGKEDRQVCLQMLYRTEENTIRCLQVPWRIDQSFLREELRRGQINGRSDLIIPYYFEEL